MGGHQKRAEGKKELRDTELIHVEHLTPQKCKEDTGDSKEEVHVHQRLTMWMTAKGKRWQTEGAEHEKASDLDFQRNLRVYVSCSETLQQKPQSPSFSINSQLPCR